MWTWWLTRNVEWDVRRIRRLRIQSERKGEVFADDDVKIFDERKVFGRGFVKRDGVVEEL